MFFHGLAFDETTRSFYFKTGALARPAADGHRLISGPSLVDGPGQVAMEALGGYHELLPPARSLAQLALVGALLVTSLLERLQLRLRAAEASRWWASNARDVLNAVAVATLWLALWLGGFSGPIALGTAGLLALAANLLQAAIEGSRLPRWAAYLLMLALGAPVLAAPGAVHALVRAVIEALR